MKIIKFQSGGTYVPPVATYTPVALTGGGRGASVGNTQTESSSDLTDKDLLKMLDKLEGLPSDMQALTSTLQNFYIDQQYSNGSTASIASRYLSALAQMRTANFNNKQFEEAYKQVSQNGGINEYAVNEHGQLFCVNKDNDFKLIRPEDLQNSEGYSPLTNAELLRIRAYNPDMAFDTSIIGVVQNGIGMETITKMIQDVVSKLGTDETKKQGYLTTNSGDIIKGLEDLQQAILQADSQNISFDGTTDDLYKYEILTKDQKLNADKALKYIYQALPENAKSILKTKTRGGSNAEAYQLISELITSQISTTRDYTIDLKAGKTSAKEKSAKDSTELQTSLPLNIMQSIGGYDQSMLFDLGDGVQMYAEGTYYQQVKKPNGDPIIDTSLKEMLAESGLQSIVKDVNNITFGDQKVSMDQLGNITYNNSGILRVNLPIKEDGSVDTDLVQRWQQAESEIKALGDNASQSQITEIMKANGLSELLDSSGKINIKKFAPFMMTQGYTLSSNNIKESPQVHKLRDVPDTLVELVKRSLTIGKGKEAVTPEVDTFSWYNPFDWFGVDDFYKAVVYIPINNNQASAAFGANQKLDYDEAVSLEQKYRNFNKQAGLQSTSADVL